MSPSTTRPALAQRLRALRQHEWPEAGLTQGQLAKAFGVADSTLASWENHKAPKAPGLDRLKDYARFFATRKSIDGEPHLVPEAQLEELERQRLGELYQGLLTLLELVPAEDTRRLLMAFDTGPVVIICPELPEKERGALADETDVNYTRLHRFADVDALLEIFGHIRALNPTLHVLSRLPSTVASEELQYHLVLLGGIGWNKTTRRIQSQLKRLPIEQFEHPDLKTGEVFRVRGEGGETVHFPEMETVDEVTELIEDVAMVARLPNPFNSGRTLTIFSGVHSRGVVGAVLTVTDETVREANEEYLGRAFPQGDFAMLVRVPVVSGRVLAPDLQNRTTRLFEWAPDGEGSE